MKERLDNHVNWQEVESRVQNHRLKKISFCFSENYFHQNCIQKINSEYKHEVKTFQRFNALKD